MNVAASNTIERQPSTNRASTRGLHDAAALRTSIDRRRELTHSRGRCDHPGPRPSGASRRPAAEAAPPSSRCGGSSRSSTAASPSSREGLWSSGARATSTSSSQASRRRAATPRSASKGSYRFSPAISGSRNGVYVDGKRASREGRTSASVQPSFASSAEWVERRGRGVCARSSRTASPSQPLLPGLLRRSRAALDAGASGRRRRATHRGSSRARPARERKASRAVHAWSGRSGPFLAVNCAALPEALAEGELFGYRRGAFTGAERANPGHLRAAHTGTLFLDEIVDLSAILQPKLLAGMLEQHEAAPIAGRRRTGRRAHRRGGASAAARGGSRPALPRRLVRPPRRRHGSSAGSLRAKRRGRSRSCS